MNQTLSANGSESQGYKAASSDLRFSLTAEEIDS